MSETREARLAEALKAIRWQCAGHADEFSRRVWQIADAALSTPPETTPEPNRVQSVLARLNASTASLQHVREGATVRDGDHISMPLPERPEIVLCAAHGVVRPCANCDVEPERPAERCPWRLDHGPHGYRTTCGETRWWPMEMCEGWKFCPYCERPLSVEEDTHE